MTNALVDIYGFIHNPSTTTSSNANANANSSAMNVNVATAPATTVVVEESEPTEISEADFLARVAAFERNEQIEAQRARTRMARWTQQTTMIKGNRDRKQCQLETYDRWNPNGKRDDEDENKDEDDGKGMGMYTAWKPPVEVEHDEYRQPPPLSHSHRPHQLQYQPPHSFSIILDNPRSQSGSGHLQQQQHEHDESEPPYAYACPKRGLGRPPRLDDHDGSKLRRPLTDIANNDYTRLRPSESLNVPFSKTRISAAAALVVTDRSPFLLPNRNSLVLVTTPATPNTHTHTNTNTNTHDGQTRGRNPVLFASSSSPQDTAAAIVSSMKNSKSKSSAIRNAGCRGTGSESEKPMTVESRRITRRTMTTSAAGGLREYRVPAHYHYHHYHHPRPRPAGPVTLLLPGPRRQVNPILVACACAC
ncbi:hypothetical protein FRB91_011417 [Serendipita sp. 411]|nr:hypothetical protein FRB91_011417 [Serendipita sp. 411]